MKFTNAKLNRRTVLRGAGLAVGLPFLDAMVPAVAKAAETKSPRRFVSFSLGLGLHGPNLFPTESGRDYAPSPYLAEIEDLVPDMTVCSGVSHPQVAGGHRAEGTILTAAPPQPKRRALSQHHLARPIDGQAPRSRRRVFLRWYSTHLVMVQARRTPRTDR